MRGDLVSRPIGEVMLEAENLVKARREGAAGDFAGHQRLRRRREVPHRLLGRQAGQDADDGAVRALGDSAELRRLGAAALRLSVPACRRSDSADGRRTRSFPTSTCRSSTRAPHPAAHEAPGERGEECSSASARWRAICPEITIRSTFIVGFPGETEEEFSLLLAVSGRGPARPRRLLRVFAGRGRGRQRLAGAVPEEVQARNAARASWTQQAAISSTKLKNRVGKTLTVLVDEPGVGRSQAEAPEIDGVVRFDGGRAGEFRQGDLDADRARRATISRRKIALTPFYQAAKRRLQ